MTAGIEPTRGRPARAPAPVAVVSTPMAALVSPLDRSSATDVAFGSLLPFSVTCSFGVAPSMPSIDKV